MKDQDPPSPDKTPEKKTKIKATPQTKKLSTPKTQGSTGRKKVMKDSKQMILTLLSNTTTKLL